MFRVLVLASLALAGCAGDPFGASDPGCPDKPSIGATCGDSDACSYEGTDQTTVCTCSEGEILSCSTCGDLRSCDPGAFCTYTDWERDCDCSCGSDGAWHCTPFYSNYGCPFGMP